MDFKFFFYLNFNNMNNNSTKKNNSNKKNNNNNINNLSYSNADTLIVALGIFIVVLILAYIYRQYKDTQKEMQRNNRTLKTPGSCPDYWDTVDEGSCRNVHKIGKCGLGHDVSFNDQMFTHPRTGEYMKCRWSKDCEAPWEHISNIC